MIETVRVLALLTIVGSVPAGARPQARATVDDVLAKLGVQATRGIDLDICFPANAREYEGMGKNGILMLKSFSAISTELPLRAAYLTLRGVRIPLTKIGTVQAEQGERGRATQVSFYLIPVHYMKSDAKLLADFSGQRTAFEVSSFSSKSTDENMPAFVKLDEYDVPQDADMKVVAEVLAREYPDYADRAR